TYFFFEVSMAPAQPVLRSIDAHVHPSTETCPTCDQPIPNEKAKEIRARAAETEKRLADAAEARAGQKLAADKLQIEQAASAKVEHEEREKVEAIKDLNVETAAKIEHAKAEGQKLAEADFIVRLAAAEKAKIDAQTARGAAEATAAQKIAATELAAKIRQ